MQRLANQPPTNQRRRDRLYCTMRLLLNYSVFQKNETSIILNIL